METQLPTTAHAEWSQQQKLWSTLTLVLIFFASATVTVAYLSHVSVSPDSQTATAATISDSFSAISLTAESAFVVDLTTNGILYARNPDAQLPLASLTKVPMALVVSEVLTPESIITVPEHNTPDGAPVRLPTGLQLRVDDLLDFSLVASSNEGSDILSNAAHPELSRKYPEADRNATTLWRMNDLAKHLGLTQTYFLNIHGLDVSTTQAGAYGSARDMARLFAYAASTSPWVFEHTSRDTLSITALDGTVITAKNTDDALSAIPGLILGKTGFTDLAGGNLAVVFEVGPAHPIVAVVLHSTADGRFKDMKELVAAVQAAIAERQY